MSFYPRIWLTCVAAFLLPFAYLCFQPLESVPAVPSGRGAGSPFLLVRNLLPEEHAKTIGVGALVVSFALFLFLAATSSRLRQNWRSGAQLRYQKDFERSQRKR